MGLLKTFNFKTKEVIGYIEHYDVHNNALINSIDIYLSGGQVVTLDLKDEPMNSEELMQNLGFNSNYWNVLYSKSDNSTLCSKDNILNTFSTASEIKPKITKYNPYE